MISTANCLVILMSDSLYPLTFSRGFYLIIAGYDEQYCVPVFVSHVAHRVENFGSLGYPVVAVLRIPVALRYFIAPSHMDSNHGYRVRI